MALFRKKGPEIIRKSSAGETIEERKTLRVRGRKVEVRRVGAFTQQKQKPKKHRNRSSGSEKANSRASVWMSV